MALIDRRRVVEAIEREAARGIAVLIAPAGFGKTEALADAFGDIALNIETAGIVGAEGVAQAIVSRAFPDAARSLSEVLRRAAGQERDDALVLWLSRRLRNTGAPIVFDDFQRFGDDPSARAFIVRLIEATAPQTRWIIASRDTPDLPLGTWISRRWMMLPITGADLAFTPDEVRELAASLHLSISDADLATIVDDAEGWPLVIRLTLDAWQRSPALPPVRIRTRDDLFEFLESQVWSATPSGHRRLLLAAALLDRAQPALLEAAGFERPAALLDGIARRSPLVRRISRNEFRLHELFRRFILDRHSDERERRGLLTQLVAASTRYGQLSEALAIAVRAGAHDLVVTTLGELGVQLIDEGQRMAVEFALRSLPLVDHHAPIVLAVRAYLHAANGDVKVAEDELRAVPSADLPLPLARAVCFRHADLAIRRGATDIACADVRAYLDDRDLGVRAEAIVQSALALSMKGEAVESRSLLKRALPLLEAVPIDLRGRLYAGVANAEFFLSDYPEAERHALTAVEFASQVENQVVLRTAYSTLSSAATWMYADTSVASDYVERWLALARQSGDRSDLARALATAVGLSADRGDDERYAMLLGELRRLTIKPDPRFDVPLRWAMAIHEVGSGRPRDAAQIMSQCVVGENFPTLRDFADSLTGLCWAMAGEEARAAECLGTPFLKIAVTSYDGYISVNAAAYRALAWWILGKSRVANRLQPIIPRDMPESLAAVVAAIRSICSTPPATMTPQKLELCIAPLRAFEQEGQVRFLRAAYRPPAATSLTRTQLAILREVRTGKSTQEIAEKIHRSPRTVDWHLDEACKKLGCSGRAAAAHYAAEQGWL
jgi:ATP/maltotriose-dependent transcriptional regulator MalT